MGGSARNSNLRVVVIGAGVVGSSIAFNLLRRNVHVTVIDADEPGHAASLVSFAWANARDKNPRHYHDLNRRSVDMWYRLARRVGGSDIITWGGEMRWSATPEGADELRTRVKTLQSWGYPIRLMGPPEVRALEPDLVTGEITAASHTDIEFHVDTQAFVRACLSKAEENGAKIVPNTRATGLSLARAGGETRVEAVVTDTGEFGCDVVVLAGGADTSELAAYAGLEVPFGHTFGATVLTVAVGAVFGNVAVVHTPRDRPPMMNLRQLKDGSVMIHGGSHGADQDESMGSSESLLRRNAQWS